MCTLRLFSPSILRSAVAGALRAARAGADQFGRPGRVARTLTAICQARLIVARRRDRPTKPSSIDSRTRSAVRTAPNFAFIRLHL
jgi:hypothetical protein